MDPITSFLPFLDKGYSGYVVAFMFLILNLTQFFSASNKQKATLHEKVVDGALARQNELDLKQSQMMNDLQEEVTSVRNEIKTVFKEMAEEREKYLTLWEQYTNVLKERADLMETVSNLQSDNKELAERIKYLEEKVLENKSEVDEQPTETEE